MVVCLPDGKSVGVRHAGDVQISNDIILRDVLYIPSSRYILLSMAELCKTSV